MTHAEMIRMRQAGFTYKQIARKSGIPYGTVRHRLQSWGIKPASKVIHPRRRPSKNDYPRWLIDELYWSCQLSTVDIAYELDIPKNSVITMMFRLGVPRRTRKEAAAVRKARGPIIVPMLSPERARAMAAKAVKKRQKTAARNARRRKSYHDRKTMVDGILS